jgi:hypothetical protein
MVTPEELAEAACDDQAWKQIQIRAAAECRATCFRAAIKILIGQIYRLGPNRLESPETKLRSVWGWIDLIGSCLSYSATTLKTFIGCNEVDWIRDLSHVIVHSGNDLPAFKPGSR